MSYQNMHGDAVDAQNTAVAGFALAMNILRSLRSRGIIDDVDFNNIVENAVAVSEPREGSGTQLHLFENLTEESRSRQNDRRSHLRST